MEKLRRLGLLFTLFCSVLAAPTSAPCGQDQQEMDGMCYKFSCPSYTISSWADADKECRNTPGGQLAMPDNDKLNKDLVNFIVKQLKNGKCASSLGTGENVWFDLKRYCPEKDANGFLWSTGAKPTNINFGTPPIEGADVCAYYDLTGQVANTDWATSKCSPGGYWGFVCEFPKKNEAPIWPIVPPVAQGECEPFWCKSGTSCYRLFLNEAYVPKSWEDAELDCREQDATLASIHDDEANNLTAALIEAETGFSNTNAWIGLTRLLSSDDSFLWSDRSAFNYKHWLPGEPNSNNDFGVESCVQQYSNGNWNDQRCDDPNSYNWICAKAVHGYEPTPTPSSSPNMGNCPMGWMPSGSRCLKYFSATKTGTQAQANNACKTKGKIRAALVSIHSAIEESALLDLLRNERKRVWIGAYNWGSTARWTDESPVTYTNWEDDSIPMGCYYLDPITDMWRNMPSTYTDGKNDCSNDDGFIQGYVCEQSKDPNLPTQAPPNPCQITGVSGFQAFSADTCFKFMGRVATWSGADNICKGEGGGARLASIEDAYELAFVTRGAGEAGIDEAWLGMSDSANPGTYVWADGRPVYIAPWGDGQPNDDGNKHCVKMVLDPMGGMSWAMAECRSNLEIICKASTKPIPTPPPLGSCPSNYISGKRLCYDISAETAKFSLAYLACIKEGLSKYGTGIVSFQNQTEVNELTTILQKGTKKVTRVFIGLVEVEGDKWEWRGLSRSHGHIPPLSFDGAWAPGQPAPNTANKFPRCAVLDATDGKWYVANCGDEYHYVCQYDRAIVTTVPPPPTQTSTTTISHGPVTGKSTTTARSPQSPGSTTTTGASANGTTTASPHHGLSGGGIAGIIIAILLLIVIAGLAAWFYHRRHPGPTRPFSFQNTEYNKNEDF